MRLLYILLLVLSAAVFTNAQNSSTAPLQLKGAAKKQFNDSTLLNAGATPAQIQQYNAAKNLANNKAKQVKKPESLPPRAHPISDRLPTSWIELTLTEGKFHQVRKMTAGVGFPCLRLIRIAIEDIRLEKMQPNEVRELKRDAIYKRLNIPLD